MDRQCARARRMFTRHSPSELPARAGRLPQRTVLAPTGTEQRSERGRRAREYPHLHAQRPGLLALRPRRLLLRRVAATLRAPLVLHGRRRSLSLQPSPAKPPFSLEKLPRSRSRGGRHTNSAGRLLLPGACGVVTPRRRTGRALRRARARARSRTAAGESPGDERFGEVVGSPLVQRRSC